MPDQMSTEDLNERLALIEGMIAEGRRDTANWAWCFVLWGAAFYIAMAWAAWGARGALSWPVTMMAASAITVFLASRKTRNNPPTTLGRAVSSVWIAVGISMFVLLSAHGDHSFDQGKAFIQILCTHLIRHRGSPSSSPIWSSAGLILIADARAACRRCDAVDCSPMSRQLSLATRLSK